MADPVHWLTLHDSARRSAVEEAASLLLQEYRLRWFDYTPIELHRLSHTLRARIQRVQCLEGLGRLLPNSGGFTILVDQRLKFQRYRFIVAHELAHTLFYTKDTEVPKRLLQTSNEEEWFCTDVARRLLAPDWLLDKVGIKELSDFYEIFRMLNEKLLLPETVAARVMLQDYVLAHGIAGVWIQQNEKWTLRKGCAFASPTLSTEQRAKFRLAALRWLKNGVQPYKNGRVEGNFSPSGKSAFVIVAEQQNVVKHL